MRYASEDEIYCMAFRCVKQTSEWQRLVQRINGIFSLYKIQKEDYLRLTALIDQQCIYMMSAMYQKQLDQAEPYQLFCWFSSRKHEEDFNQLARAKIKSYRRKPLHSAYSGFIQQRINRRVDSI